MTHSFDPLPSHGASSRGEFENLFGHGTKLLFRPGRTHLAVKDSLQEHRNGFVVQLPEGNLVHRRPLQGVRLYAHLALDAHDSVVVSGENRNVLAKPIEIRCHWVTLVVDGLG